MRFLSLVAFLAVMLFGALQEASGIHAQATGGKLSTTQLVQMVHTTTTETELIGQLDQFFQTTGWQAGNQTQTKMLIPANSVFWGDSTGANIVGLPEDFLQIRGRVRYAFKIVEVYKGGRYVQTDSTPNLCRDFPEFASKSNCFRVNIPLVFGPQPVPLPVPSPNATSLLVSQFAALFCGTPSNDPAPLIRELDKFWDTSEGKIGGQNPTSLGMVPGNTVAWTDLAGISVPPDKAVSLRTKGTWGVHALYEALFIGKGGRWARLDRVLNPVKDIPCWGGS